MARPRRHGARLPLRRPWEWGRVWVPADFYVLRRICECVAGNANPDEGPQVRAVVRILSAARVRHVGQTSDHLRDAHLLAGQAQPEFERAASHSGRCRVRTIDTSTPFTCHNVRLAAFETSDWGNVALASPSSQYAPGLRVFSWVWGRFRGKVHERRILGRVLADPLHLARRSGIQVDGVNGSLG